MITFIDTEVSTTTHQIEDFGAVREDEATCHTHSTAEFNKFISVCDTICGHNIINHDLKYLNLPSRYTAIDTLPLSPLLFPAKPYHHLLKDDKLQVEELNNPLNDSLKARDLFYDEVAAWNSLSAENQIIYYQLLHQSPLFSGFFKYLGYTASSDNISELIKQVYRGKICENADIQSVVKYYPIELAYSLAIIGVDDFFSITPAWVLHNYPKINNVNVFLRNTPCGRCQYCEKKLDSHQGLKEFFGYNEFRLFDGEPMQQQAVESAIRGESILTIFPTGGGKSLTFQLPALMAGRNIHGLTVVISPLQSLMKDQVDNLTARGISDVVTINGLLDPLERASAIEQVANGTANILYIAPEMLRSSTIERLLMSRNVVRFVIDEAHCFSAWGQDFRTDYLYIGDFIKHIQEKKQQYRPIAVSCFTATAKQKVISDICDYFLQKLGLNLKIFAAKADRQNLHYHVLHTETAEQKYTLLRNLICGCQCPVIVYVARTKRTYELTERLNKDGISALPFNGKMESVDKVANQNSFMSAQTQVIVATSAFGMGVDKKDVGLVIHYDISDSLENYVQEAGRAGRDPHMQADCYVLFDDADLDKHFILLNQTKLSISEIQRVWKAIRDFTKDRSKVSCSPLEIARQAGWNDDNTNEIETRVRGAITALEQAGFITRSNNSVNVFATGIKVRTMDEVRHRLNTSKYFDDKTREEAAKIIRSLISSRATANNKKDAESRVDYLSDILGLPKETVIRNINLMQQEGLLADTRDMQAYINNTKIKRNLEDLLRLESFILDHITTETTTINYKHLNSEAQSAGHKCNVKILHTILHFMLLKGYIYKQEHTASESVSIRFQTDKEVVKSRFEVRANICRFIADRINEQVDNKTVNFSLIEWLNEYNISQQSDMFAHNNQTTITDFEEALLYMSKMELIKIDGGFMVVYSPMIIQRNAERARRYGKEQYRLLDEFYRQRIQQIHIVGEFANLMVRDYDAAMQFVSDYFLTDYRDFIVKYFKGERRLQIQKNITPAKYQKIFGVLSPLQRQIIDDKQSKYIVVAAGPGSGKTRVLVHKLASLLLMEDVKHEQLLMLTFSRAAATEFKKRLMDLIGSAAHFVDIKTFHSYSFDLIGRQGTLEESNTVVSRAAEMIENNEVEESKITKSVLVIDEAQDMGADDFRLVQALMQRNEDMRIIAVGDDDQNIYAFRGSDSKHMKSLITIADSALYEMTDNYRSDIAIIDYTNAFVKNIPNRMKSQAIVPISKQQGRIIVTQTKNASFNPKTDGTTAILTATNEQTLQIAYMLKQQGKQVRQLQNTDTFHFFNLAEIRYFLKHIGSDDNGIISRAKWDDAQQKTLDNYSTSTCLDIIRCFFNDFEQTHKTFYHSDLHEFIFESNIDDFINTEKNTFFVSTIHKAKGREFDTVYLILDGLQRMDSETMRAIYVGITRARHNLYILNDASFLDNQKNIIISLSMKDVWLDFYKTRKKAIMKLRSGDHLTYDMGYLKISNGEYIARLSTKMQDKITEKEKMGYKVIDAQVSYILAWKPKEETEEVAVCLANLILEKE